MAFVLSVCDGCVCTDWSYALTHIALCNVHTHIHHSTEEGERGFPACGRGLLSHMTSYRESWLVRWLQDKTLFVCANGNVCIVRGLGRGACLHSVRVHGQNRVNQPF